MRIALDYDGTYDRDPGLWQRFILDALNAGHSIICVTMRSARHRIVMPRVEVIYTDGKAKVPFCKARNLEVNVWIDDYPNCLLNDNFFATQTGSLPVMQGQRSNV